MSEATFYTHSSSIDFCERNYTWSPYIVELHNTWSSLLIGLPSAIGLFRSNPTREWRFVVLHLVMVFVSLGSVMLHGTLHALPQSFDEVPMLWATFAFFYALIEAESPLHKPRYTFLGPLLTAITVAQTVIYYAFQDLYWVFLTAYISLAAMVAYLGYLLAYSPRSHKVVKVCWHYGVVMYILIAGPLWLLDMNLCHHLLPLYDLTGGMTLHIIWHMGAGFGTYMLILSLEALRVQRCLGQTPEIQWAFGCCPVIGVSQITTEKSK